MWATKTTEGPTGADQRIGNWAAYCLDRLKPWTAGSRVRLEWTLPPTPGVQAPSSAALTVEAADQPEAWRGLLEFSGKTPGSERADYCGQQNCERAVHAAVKLVAEGRGELYLTPHGDERLRERVL
jgi:hypothetical protein